MAEIPIVDAHVHLWNPQTLPMPWLSTAPALNRAYDMTDYAQQTAALPIAGMVYIEVDVAPQFALLEAQQVVALAQHEPRLQGIIPSAPVEYGAQLRPYLQAIQALGPLVKGVRRLMQDAAPDYCLQPAFIEGVQLLAEFGFSFDICIRHHQLPAATELVRRCPAVSFILDHMGKPDIRQHLRDPWQANLQRLAALPNVACKISGLVTEADPQQWQIADLAPYVAHALEVFGSERVLFGSDWPVMTEAATYPRWIAAVEQLISALPETAQHAFWHDNAQRWYRLA